MKKTKIDWGKEMIKGMGRTLGAEDVVRDLKEADTIIKGRHRYNCGLMGEDKTKGIMAGRADFFFESPDGQNGELYYEMRKLGYRNSGYNAPYHWGVSKDGFHIEYVEGDVYVRPLADIKK